MKRDARMRAARWIVVSRRGALYHAAASDNEGKWAAASTAEGAVRELWRTWTDTVALAVMLEVRP